MNKEIKQYIEKQKSPQKEILKKLNNLLVKTIPGIKEEFKMGVPWYEDRFYLVSLKDHVNFGFAIKKLTKEEKNLFEGNGQIMRHLKFFSKDEIDSKKIAKLVNLVWKKHK